MDNRAYQELLWKVAQNQGLQVEEVMESVDPIMDILVPKGTSRLTLPLITLKLHQTTSKTP